MSGLPLIGSRVKYLPLRGWGEYVGLDGITTRTTESSLALFRNVRQSRSFMHAWQAGTKTKDAPNTGAESEIDRNLIDQEFGHHSKSRKCPVIPRAEPLKRTCETPGTRRSQTTCPNSES